MKFAPTNYTKALNEILLSMPAEQVGGQGLAERLPAGGGGLQDRQEGIEGFEHGQLLGVCLGYRTTELSWKSFFPSPQPSPYKGEGVIHVLTGCLRI